MILLKEQNDTITVSAYVERASSSPPHFHFTEYCVSSANTFLSPIELNCGIALLDLQISLQRIESSYADAIHTFHAL